MLKMKTFIAAVAFVCLAQLHVSNAKVRTLEKIYFQNDFNYFSIDDGYFTYGQCDNEKAPNQCKFKQLQVSTNQTKFSCEINLKKDDTYKYAIFRDFGKGRLIVVQVLEQEIVIYTVQLAECKMSEGFHLPESKNHGFFDSIGYQLKQYSLIVPYDDWFHIFFHDIDRCGTKQCRLAITFDGKRIIGPIPHMDYKHVDNFVDTIYSVAGKSPNKGHVYFTNSLDGHYHNLSLADADGVEKQLARLAGTNSVRLYVSNELIGACVFYGSKPNVTCTQYDSHGNINLHKDFNVKTIPAYLYNLPRGGFLAFVMETENIEERDAYAEMYVLKINATGETVGKVSVQGLDYTKKWTPLVAPSLTQLWQDEQSKEYCVSFVPSVEPVINVVVNCFDDADFVH